MALSEDQAKQQQSPSEIAMDLENLLPRLAADGLLPAAGARELALLYRATRGASKTTHPMIWLAERRTSIADTEHLTLERLMRWLADDVGLTYFSIDPLKIDVESVTSVVSTAYATRYRILPVAVDATTVTFATADPYEREWEQELSHVLNREVRRVIASPLDITRYQDELFGVSHSIRKANQAGANAAIAGIGNVEALVELGRSGKLDANDRHIVTIVDWLLQYAFDQRASDIHLEPRRDGGNIRFRIDGVLHNVYQLPGMITAAVTSRIKALGRMDVVEKRRPQDGRVKTRTPNGEEVELRLSTMPTAHGEKLVMRIFDPQVLVRGLGDLGFSKADAQAWRGMTSRTHGIVLVTGPTGSGKTTTLYSTLKHLAKPDVNICTVEDPIEMVEGQFNQMQVNHQIGLDFATGVRTLMRQDPDIVMVGEIRDLETAEMAIQAALTGHLVLSTLHTNDAPAAVTRLMDIGVPPYLINATILGITAQRLVRTLCPDCKAPVATDEAAWRGLTRPWKMNMPEQVHGAVGCEQCRDTGYRGRVGIYEILQLSETTRSAVTADCDLADLRRLGLKEGMEPLRISGARKVLAGITTLEEVMRVAPTHDSL